MAKLSDYGIKVNELDNVSKVKIDGHMFPVVLSFEAFEYIADVYGEDYSVFEDDLNDFLKRSNGEIRMSAIRKSDWQLVKSLVYGMLRAGGLEEKPTTIFTWLGMRPETIKVFSACMQIFSKQNFQEEDLKKSKEPQDFQRKKGKNSKQKVKRK